MALQKDITKFGTTLQAYHRVQGVIVSKEVVRINVDIFHQQNGDYIESVKYRTDYDVNGGEPLTQAYNYLKTLPEYAGATDV